MTNTEKILEEFDEKFPCIQGQCDNNGTLRGSDGDPEQCQYCYEHRLPIKSFIESLLKSKQEEIEGEMEQIREEKPIVSPPESDVYMHTLAQFNRVAGVNATLDDLKPIISNILK